MRYVASFLAIFGFLSPLSVSAMTTDEIVLAVSSVPGHSFQFTIHGKNTDGMYFSVWGKGSMNLDTQSMDASATIDFSGNGMKGRLKGGLRFVENQGFFFKVDTVDSSYSDLLTSFNVDFAMKEWIRMDMGILGDAENYEDWMTMMVDTQTSTNDIFTVQESPAGTFILQLKPDAASAVAAETLDFLGGDRPIVQDFFPWRALAESMEFQSVVKTADGMPVSRSTTINVTGAKTYFTLAMQEQFSKTAPDIKAPATFKTEEDLWSMFMSGIPGDAGIGNMTIFGTEFDTIDTGDSYDWPVDDEGIAEDFGSDYQDTSDWPTGWDSTGDCYSAEDAVYVSILRSGECMTERVSRRNLVR
jgi:hypothetical protein